VSYQPVRIVPRQEIAYDNFAGISGSAYRAAGKRDIEIAHECNADKF